jgi:hypothetical protein
MGGILHRGLLLLEVIQGIGQLRAKSQILTRTITQGDQMTFTRQAAIRLIALASLCAGTSVLTAQNSSADTTRKPVLVELFTSEGCSTCPPADVLLQRLESDQPVATAQIIAVEEHVDYWNHDGWLDPFSSASWTERQQVYTSIIKKDPYTPEIVVDGQAQFVGNNPKDAFMAIEDASHKPKTPITISQVSREGKGARFNISVGKLAGDVGNDQAEVWLAVTEDGLHSAVDRGENAGHQLNHTATLRYLHKIGNAQANDGNVSFSGDDFVKFNGRWTVQNLHAVVFVQQKKSRQIIGAASIAIKG